MPFQRKNAGSSSRRPSGNAQRRGGRTGGGGFGAMGGGGMGGAGMGNAFMQEQLRAAPTASPDQGLLGEAGFSGNQIALPYQEELEALLGVDLSEIQAYIGNAEAMASLAADAFATGNIVAFSDANPTWEQVLEEVTHVLQQGRGQGRGISDPGSSSERAARAGRNQGTGRDASLHRDASTTLPERTPTVGEITLAAGKDYIVTADDIAGGESSAWRSIARAHGMHEDYLIPFNQHVETVERDGEVAQEVKTPTLAAGVKLYIPSAQEHAFAQCRKRAATLEEAEQLYGQLASGSNIKVLEAARMRGSGQTGVAYGNKGVEQRNGNAGPFLTPNPNLAGASSRRSETIDGQTEYRVNWNATNSGFWKCSVFLHDVLFQAGYTPHVTDNNHYQLAGRLHESPHVTEIPVGQAGPGQLWQRFGGRGSDESHNAILTSFVDVKNIDENTDEWTFSILGAEMDSAGESIRTKRMKAGTNETTDGKFIRFFKPQGT